MILTTADRDIVIHDINLTLTHLFQSDTSILELLSSEVSYLTEETIRSFLEANHIDFTDKSLIKEKLIDIRTQLSNAQTIRLALSFSPSSSFITILSGWFTKYFNTRYFLDIHVDPDIIGGVILINEGTYIDLSLKKKFDTYFSQNKEKILKDMENHPN